MFPVLGNSRKSSFAAVASRKTSSVSIEHRNHSNRKQSRFLDDGSRKESKLTEELRKESIINSARKYSDCMNIENIELHHNEVKERVSSPLTIVSSPITSECAPKDEVFTKETTNVQINAVVVEKKESKKAKRKSMKKKKDEKLAEREKVLRQHSHTMRFYKNAKTFKNALELLNRSNAVDVDGGWYAGEVFFECKGELSVAQKMCTHCHDDKKKLKSTDLYYVNLCEVSRQRHIYCQQCMEEFVYIAVGNNEVDLRKKLYTYKRFQPNGIVIKP